jgi:RND family efflux transporter MFP subunit
LLGGAAALLLAVSWDSLGSALPVQVAPVVGKRVEGSTGEATVQAAGWLEPFPYPTYVPALVPGVVEEVLVLEGDRVEAGQVVARLIDDDAKLAAAEAAAELEEARALLASAEADHVGAQRALELLIDRKRDTERHAAMVAGIQASLAQLEASVKAKQSAVEVIDDEHERMHALVEGGSATRGQDVQLELRLKSAQAELEALRLQRTVLQADLAQAQAELRAARSHAETLVEERRAAAVAEAALARAKARADSARARHENAQLQLSRHEVRALSGGIVLRRMVSPGSRIMFDGGGGEHGADVMRLYDPAALQVRVDVPLADAAQVGHGQRAQVSVEALPDRVFTGKVVRVVHEADLQKNTVEFKVQIEDPVETLKPEMLARVRFLAQVREGEAGGALRLFVPRSALVNADGPTARVWVVAGRQGARGRVRPREVSLGSETAGDAVEVRSGLQVGDEVVVSPSPALTEDAKVQVSDAAEAP